MMDSTTAHQAAVKKLPPGRRKAVSVSPEQLVWVELLETGQTLPLVARPALKGVDLLAWERGGVLMLDNMLSAHARRPFVGEREILVGMGEPTRGQE